MSLVFGIDLGTTYSCIAYMDEYGKPVVLPNVDGEDTTPSVVLFETVKPKVETVVGMEAKRSAKVEADRVVQFIKRKMGKEEDTVTIDGVEFHAPEVSSYILQKLVKDANSQLLQEGVLQPGEEVKDVVITCPAYFGMNEKQATKTAGEMAGLNVLNIIQEPTAAAISYGVSGKEKNETVLIYDLGGGTFDITVIHIEGNRISVVVTGGDDQLGGKDWDETLMDYVVSRYAEETGEDLYEDPEAIAELYLDVETWKKTLSAREKVNISLSGPGGRFREEMTRQHYDELTRDLLNRTRSMLDDTLQKSAAKGYPLERIDKFLLVGGSSRMPQVAAMLKQVYGKEPILQDPNLAVAKGAAIYAKNQKGFNEFIEEQAARTGKTVQQLEEENLTTGRLDQQYAALSMASGEAHISISNVLSRTYGVESLDENHKPRIYNMLMINSSLPAHVAQEFCTAFERQNSAIVKIYESRSTEGDMDIDREPITSCELKIIHEVPKGTPIRVELGLDNSGMLHIVAEDGLTHSRLDTTFQLSNQMGDTELRNAMSRASSATVE